jgi:hypothetical protein
MSIPCRKGRRFILLETYARIAVPTRRGKERRDPNIKGYHQKAIVKISSHRSSKIESERIVLSAPERSPTKDKSFTFCNRCSQNGARCKYKSVRPVWAPTEISDHRDKRGENVADGEEANVVIDSAAGDTQLEQVQDQGKTVNKTESSFLYIVMSSLDLNGSPIAET